MNIYGVALLAICYLTGQLVGEGLGKVLGIDANVGGVGFAMLILVLAGDWLSTKGHLKADSASGITFWSQMYIPIIVAMAATQNVAAAISGGLLALLAGVVPAAIAFALIPVLSRIFPSQPAETL